MSQQRSESTDSPIRFALPSKGRMQEETLQFLTKCGFTIKKKKREYIGKMEEFPEMDLIFHRQKDILRGIEAGALDFGILGLDMLKEYGKMNPNPDVFILHEDLNFGECSLSVAIPVQWKEADFGTVLKNHPNLRIATKFVRLVKNYLQQHFPRTSYEIVEGNGSLEVYPALGYADIIVDLVSTGDTLKANNLKEIDGGKILHSQAIFVANQKSLKNPQVKALAQILLEYIEATLRAKNFVQIFANIKNSNRQEIVEELFNHEETQGLDGPTISSIYMRDGNRWNDVHVIIHRNQLPKIMKILRKMGGSGIIVSPLLYIFEDEPDRVKRLLLFN